MSFINNITKKYKIQTYHYVEPKINVINNYKLYTKYKNKSLSKFDFLDVNITKQINKPQILTNNYIEVKNEIVNIKKIYGELSEFHNVFQNNENVLDRYSIYFETNNTKIRTHSILIENYFEKYLRLIVNSFINKQDLFNYSEINSQIPSILNNDSSCKLAILNSLKLLTPVINKNMELTILNYINFNNLNVTSKKNFTKILKNELLNYLIPIFSNMLIREQNSILDKLEVEEFTNVINTFVNSIDLNQLQEISNNLMNNDFDNSEIIYVKSYVCNYFVNNIQNIFNLKYLTKSIVKKENDLLFSTIELLYNDNISTILPISVFKSIIKKSINSILLDYFESSNYNNYLSTILGELYNIYTINNVKFNMNSVKIILHETISSYIMSSNWDDSFIYDILYRLDFSNYIIDYTFQSNIFSDVEYDNFVASFAESCLILYFYLSLYIYKT